MQTASTAITSPVLSRTAIAIFASLACAASLAQEATDEEPREYNVEVIVFVYEEDVSVGNEVFPPESLPELPFSAIEDDATEPVDLQPADAVEEDNVAAAREDLLQSDDGYLPDFVITPVDELGMTDIAEKLERLDVYRPILHAAWTQRALPREQSVMIDLEMLTDPPPNLNGSLQLYLSRFLHLVVDLTLDNGDSAPIAVDVPGRSLLFSDEPARRPGVVHYRIEDDRIFKNGDTRYFDHPRFGVIARVTRIEPPEEEEDAASGDAETLDGGTGDQVIE